MGEDAKSAFYQRRSQAMNAMRRYGAMSLGNRLINIDLMARVNFDSMDCWPKQETVAADLGCDVKTVKRAIAEGVKAGWWRVNFDGRSNHYEVRFEALCQGTKMDYQTEPKGQKRASSQDKNGPSSRDKNGPLIDKLESNNERSPPDPHSAEPSESGLSDEVKPGKPSITFDRFWEASGRVGQPGPALALWRKLSDKDRWQIKAHVDGPINGRNLDLEGMWASTWLLNRRFDAAPLGRKRVGREAYGHALRELGDFARSDHTFVVIKPSSAEWDAERARRLACGESVRMMDSFAEQGKTFTLRIGVEAARQQAAE